MIPLPFSAISVADNKQSPPDLTTSNILFPLSPRVIEWSDAEVYAHLGEPQTEEIYDEKPPGVHAPAMLVEPIQNSRISHSSLRRHHHQWLRPIDLPARNAAKLPASGDALSLRDVRASRRTSGCSDARSLKSVQAFPSLNPFMSSDVGL